MIQVIYWSDYVCPFCYIGSIRLKRAVAELGAEDKVEIVMRAFELDRHAPIRVRYTAAEHFAEKYGLPLDVAQSKVNEISEAGREEGISEMDYANTRSTNTLDAHRLTKYAIQEVGVDLREMMYYAFFCAHLNIGEKSVLLELADRSKLPLKRTTEILNSSAYEDEVRRDEREAALLDIHTIPHYLIAEKYHISSYGTVEKLKTAISKALQ